MRYWWVSQGNNYPIVMDQRILWSRPTSTNVVPENRRLLKDMQRGDIVFHYAGPYLRTVSRVREEATTALRPRGHKVTDHEKGWLVRIEPLATDLEIHRHRVAELIQHGTPGPLTVTGEPARKYVSPLTDEEGQRLLLETGVVLRASAETPGSLLGRPASSWEDQETDTQGLTTIRREQDHLRRHLLQGRVTARCALCGKTLPARVLIAGHIKPRNKCTEAERTDFKAAAMLVCALGCDALFEWGYIVVDANGEICAGRPSETEDLQTAVNRLIGRSCSAHNETTATNFEAHRIFAAQAM